MKLLNIKMLMGHDTGLEKSYYKPSEKEILDDYLKAISVLSFFSPANSELQKDVRELKKSNEQNEYLIQVKLKEKEDALNSLSDKFLQLEADIAELKKQK